MDTNKILSATILDLIFEDRNKEYGAYELRKTYPKRIGKALLITCSIGLLAFGGAILANSFKPDNESKPDTTMVTIDPFKDEKPPEELPKPEQKPEPIQKQTLQFTTPVITEVVDEPPPAQEDLTNKKIDVMTQEGVPDEGLADVQETVGEGKGVIEKPAEPQGPWTKVEVEARCACDWERFLRKNLDPQVPVDNGAPAGKYTVIIQFVVDIDGSVSELKPLTSHGYGMEQEAIRVLKRAMKWEPAYQNKMHVKAYRRQPITFEVDSGE